MESGYLGGDVGVGRRKKRKKKCREGENGGKEMGVCGHVVEEKWIRERGKKNESQNGEENGKRRGEQRVWGKRDGFQPCMGGVERRKMEKI